MLRLSFFGLLVLAAGLSACREAEPKRVLLDENARSGTGSHAGSKIIATLRFQNGFVEICTSSSGRPYNVLDKEGQLLAAGLTPAEMEAKYPSHFQAIHSGLADVGFPGSVAAPRGTPATGKPPILDASADVNSAAR